MSLIQIVWRVKPARPISANRMAVATPIWIVNPVSTVIRRPVNAIHLMMDIARLAISLIPTVVVRAVVATTLAEISVGRMRIVPLDRLATPPHSFVMWISASWTATPTQQIRVHVATSVWMQRVLGTMSVLRTANG